MEHDDTLAQAEDWSPVKNYEGLYEVSSLGRVRNCSGRVHTTSPNKYLGYHQVRLTKNKINKCFYVHRLVVEAFLGEIPQGMHVNHKDCNRANNKLENLEIVSPLQNNRHAIENGRVRPHTIIPDQDVLAIRSLKGEETTRNTAKRFGISQSQVSLIQNLKSRSSV